VLLTSWSSTAEAGLPARRFAGASAGRESVVGRAAAGIVGLSDGGVLSIIPLTPSVTIPNPL